MKILLLLLLSVSGVVPCPARTTHLPVGPMDTPTSNQAFGEASVLANPVTGIPGPVKEGVYEMVKASGSSVISLGDLEIRGTTCQALGQGGFKTFTVDSSGNITWAPGLSILPDGWKIRRSVYTKDSRGNPLIQIFYTSDSGTDDSLDAYLKK